MISAMVARNFWWSAALETARAAVELPPGSFRARAALAAQA